MLESVQASHVSVACFVGLLLVAAASDIVSYKIPNAVVLAILLLYPVYVIVTPADVDWPWALAVFAAAIVVGIGISATGKLGAGDAKLLAAVLLWAGPALAPITLLICTFAGGALATIMLTPARFIVAGALSSLGSETLSSAMLAKNMPYGVAISAGGLFVAWVLITTV
ncbi:MAG: prepilin peptidase [Gammaproteobacteria bacterium]|nr:prepilin peptidase [Gammaproteobacteria bacterium]